MNVSQEKHDIKVTESKTEIEKETEHRAVKETRNEKPENSLETYIKKESERKVHENSEKETGM